MNKQIKRKLIVIAGPTASGKSDFAVDFALLHNGVIVSADSRQVYKGLDIGSGKITQIEMKDVEHVGLNMYNISEETSVARYTTDILPVIEEIFSRGKTPIICGGSGQYIDALIYETAFPKVLPNQVLRNELEKLHTDDLVARLLARDPSRASSLDTHNRRRIIRAIEIVEVLGAVPKLPERILKYDTDVYLLNPNREILKKRIHKRLLKRLSEGMIEEVQNLITSGVTYEKLYSLGLEYRYISSYIKGELTYAEMTETIFRKTYKYAKRQITWNKKHLPNPILIEIE